MVLLTVSITFPYIASISLLLNLFYCTITMKYVGVDVSMLLSVTPRQTFMNEAAKLLYEVQRRNKSDMGCLRDPS